MGALGDPTRLAIFERLAREPQAVGELAAAFPISRPAVSQHLRILKEARLVTDRRNGGNNASIEIDPAGVASLRAYFEHFWNDALAAFKRAAEERDTAQ